MDFYRTMAAFIERPLLALVPGVIFALAYARCRRPVVLAAAVAWLAYALYEQAMKLRILCSGECNIRVDLLLLYPLLAILSAVGIFVFLRSTWRERQR
jgi:hypothetical protein